MRTALTCAVAVALVAPVANAYTQYTMTQAGFSPTWVQYTQHFVGTGGSGISYGQTSGGNPGEHRAFETAVNAAAPGQHSAYYISLLFANSYDPATQGAIPQLTYREDFRTATSIQYSGPVVRQGGNFYFAPVLVASAANWTSTNLLTLTASDFYLVTNNANLAYGLDTTVNPDFSAAGGVIDFGIFRGSTSGPVPGGGGDSAVGYIDNAQITIPAPAVMAVVGCGLLMSRRRRRVG
ncbi:MAG TPA: hypothetical protein VD997_13965 [Phycisphaerales bacterium]|nr:hypothetical protein [Phycisphaerales bacterium]